KPAPPAPVMEIARDSVGVPEVKKPIVPTYELAQLNLKLGEREIPDLPVSTLAGWVQQVVATESPVHEQEVIRRIADAADVPRIGSRLRLALESAITNGVKYGRIRQEKQFLWAPEMPQPTIRDRSQLPPGSKNIQFIAPEEIMLAIQKVVADAFGMPWEEIPGAVTKLLGLGRLNEDIREQVELVTEEMMQTGQLKNQEGLILSGKT
ncbi:MAG: hypothetical protein COW65_00315, partial [Cytophagales bacterium CG18_big_fil_WC_8_21_14_2_50_42_9]